MVLEKDFSYNLLHLTLTSVQYRRFLYIPRTSMLHHISYFFLPSAYASFFYIVEHD